MGRYLLDTNIFIWLDKFTRNKRCPDGLTEFIIPLINQPNVELFISAFSIAELLVLMDVGEKGPKGPKGSHKRIPWTDDRRENLWGLVSKMNIVYWHAGLINQYYLIDCYSRRVEVRVKNIDYLLPPNIGDVDMKKNDLWIASTALHHGLTLITTDAGFNHLPFLHLVYLEATPRAQ